MLQKIGAQEYDGVAQKTRIIPVNFASLPFDMATGEKRPMCNILRIQKFNILLLPKTLNPLNCRCQFNVKQNASYIPFYDLTRSVPVFRLYDLTGYVLVSRDHLLLTAQPDYDETDDGAPK